MPTMDTTDYTRPQRGRRALGVLVRAALIAVPATAIALGARHAARHAEQELGPPTDEAPR